MAKKEELEKVGTTIPWLGWVSVAGAVLGFVAVGFLTWLFNRYPRTNVVGTGADKVVSLVRGMGDDTAAGGA